MDASPSTRRVLHFQAREIVYSIYKYFSDEKANGTALIDPPKALARTARATTISEKIISRTCTKARGNSGQDSHKFQYLLQQKRITHLQWRILMSLTKPNFEEQSWDIMRDKKSLHSRKYKRIWKTRWVSVITSSPGARCWKEWDSDLQSLMVINS